MKQHTSTSLKKTAKTLPLSFFLLILDHKQFLTYFFSDDVKIEENVFETWKVTGLIVTDILWVMPLL